MLDEEKVILMTKMTAFIDREGKKNDAINTYFRSDYVGFNIIKSVRVEFYSRACCLYRQGTD